MPFEAQYLYLPENGVASVILAFQQNFLIMTIYKIKLFDYLASREIWKPAKFPGYEIIFIPSF